MHLDSCSPGVKRFERCIEQLWQDETNLIRSSNRVNRSYYKLGEAYVLLAGLPAQAELTDIASRKFHRKGFSKVTETYLKYEKDKQSSGLRKRLERARKFYIIGHLFGTAVLDRHDIINVGAVDSLPFKALCSFRLL